MRFVSLCVSVDDSGFLAFGKPFPVRWRALYGRERHIIVVVVSLQLVLAVWLISIWLHPNSLFFLVLLYSLFIKREEMCSNAGRNFVRRLPLVGEEEEEKKNACLHVPIFNGASL